MLICGIDEAGRGPVIGPLVLCGILIDEKDEKELKINGIKDSKLLTKKKREYLFDKIKKIVKRHKIIIIEPKEIDEALKSDHLNLNWLEAVKSAEIINNLKPEKVVLDCPSNNIKAYTRYLKRHLDEKIEIIAEHKADFKYVTVAAASILAKVTRDREIEKIKKKIKVDFGSGYPSDENTKRFVELNHDKFPNIFRKTWQPYKTILRKKGQKKLGEF